MIQGLDNQTVLLLVDLQKGIDSGTSKERNNPTAEETVGKLLTVWRERGFPVVHIRHDSTEPDSALQGHLPGYDFKDGLEPCEGEAQFIKQVNGPFTGTKLDDWLKERGINTLLICGMVTDHCVSTTAREAENRGYTVYVVEDGTATFGRTVRDHEFDAETIHLTALAQLNNEFAEIVNSEEIFASVRQSNE